MKHVTRWAAAAAFAALLLAPFQSMAQSQPTYQGLWWNAPAGSQNGWGLNLTHQGTIIFGTWFTYDADGRGTWMVLPRMDLIQVDEMDPGDGYGGYGGYYMPTSFVYSGLLYRPEGPAFNGATFDGNSVNLEEVGRATLRFTDPNNGSFQYTINGVSGTKSITRLVYARMPMCEFMDAPPAGPANYQDLWWRSPPGSENGWGVNLTHQGDILFATWFTYDAQRRPLWFVMSNGHKTGANTYSGKLYRTRGPAWNSATWNPDAFHLDEAGTATFTFTDASTGTFSATVDGATQVKPITRLVFSGPGTYCR